MSGPRVALLVASSIALCASGAGDAAGQTLPRGATPRGVLYAFLTETCGGDSSVNRADFRQRLSGELVSTDPATFRGTVPSGSGIRIDSIPDLPPTRGRRRAVAYVTLQLPTWTENRYFFLGRDSIWRIEAARELPREGHRVQIQRALSAADTSSPALRLRRNDLQRLLLSDDSLAAVLRANLPAVEKAVGPLRRDSSWRAFALREVEFLRLEEYRELDDDISRNDLIFYTLDRRAIERLKQEVGVRRISRDSRYPGVLFLESAAIDRSHYGYLTCDRPADVPTPDPSDFIAVKPVAPGWWLYKRIVR